MSQFYSNLGLKFSIVKNFIQFIPGYCLLAQLVTSAQNKIYNFIKFF